MWVLVAKQNLPVVKILKFGWESSEDGRQQVRARAQGCGDASGSGWGEQWTRRLRYARGAFAMLFALPPRTPDFVYSEGQRCLWRPQHRGPEEQSLVTADEHRPRPQPWRPGPCSPAADTLAGLASLSWPQGDGTVDAVFPQHGRWWDLQC